MRKRTVLAALLAIAAAGGCSNFQNYDRILSECTPTEYYVRSWSGGPLPLQVYDCTGVDLAD